MKLDWFYKATFVREFTDKKNTILGCSYEKVRGMFLGLYSFGMAILITSFWSVMVNGSYSSILSILFNIVWIVISYIIISIMSNFFESLLEFTDEKLIDLKEE